jgi:hypothetical protein
MPLLSFGQFGSLAISKRPIALRGRPRDRFALLVAYKEAKESCVDNVQGINPHIENVLRLPRESNAVTRKMGII